MRPVGRLADDAASELALVALRVLAAAIVIPTVVRHAQDRPPADVSFTRRRL